jgi:hypothetical protein
MPGLPVSHEGAGIMTINSSVIRFAKVAAVTTMAIAGTGLGIGSALADQAVYSCTNADGTVELTSEPANKEQCELLSGSAEATADKAAATPVDGQAAAGDAPKVDPRQQYRELMLQKAQTTDSAKPANPATSRRYLKTDRAGYEQLQQKQQEQSAAAAAAAAAAAQ